MIWTRDTDIFRSLPTNPAATVERVIQRFKLDRNAEVDPHLETPDVYLLILFPGYHQFLHSYSIPEGRTSTSDGPALWICRIHSTGYNS